jgi:hypothetical protein
MNLKYFSPKQQSKLLSSPWNFLQKFLEANENEKYNLPESLGHSKGSAKVRFIAMSASLKTSSQINDLMFHLKLLGKTRTSQIQKQ